MTDEADDDELSRLTPAQKAIFEKVWMDMEVILIQDAFDSDNLTVGLINGHPLEIQEHLFDRLSAFFAQRAKEAEDRDRGDDTGHSR
jgi:hypothetical protein